MPYQIQDYTWGATCCEDDRPCAPRMSIISIEKILSTTPGYLTDLGDRRVSNPSQAFVHLQFCLFSQTYVLVGWLSIKIDAMSVSMSKFLSSVTNCISERVPSLVHLCSKEDLDSLWRLYFLISVSISVVRGCLAETCLRKFMTKRPPFWTRFSGTSHTRGVEVEVRIELRRMPSTSVHIYCALIGTR